jgi:predicted metal-binding membrane protein|tara:strand:+ start:14336 stop:15028 length:693 start_codon:yes stop_codon:yes gene_type:complete
VIPSVIVFALAWVVLAAGGPGLMSTTAGDAVPWGAGQFATVASMWIVMMVAMMLPTVAPWVAALSTIGRRMGRGLPAGEFVAGYLLVWSGFSVAAASVQWGLHEAGWLSAASSLGPQAAGGLLIVAGVYQWTPAKQACLKHCRSPLGFFLTSWRSGRWGPARMGLRHGAFCVACCWALMALSFVAGVMNLIWMALVALFVLVDHAVARGPWLGRAAGAALAVWGVGLVAS